MSSLDLPNASTTGALKRELRDLAKGGPGRQFVELTLPENKYTVWYKKSLEGFFLALSRNLTGAVF